MSKLIIRKRVGLEFLGEQYSAAYIEFRSIPVGDYDALIQKINKVEDAKANEAILNILKDYFLGGKFPNDDGEPEDLDGKEELDGLDRDALIECFGKLTGQDLKGMIATKAELRAQGASDLEIDAVGTDVDPKSEPPLKDGSTAENPSQ
jgi:hypothetical protein